MDNSILSVIRSDFPILQTEVYRHPLIYLDNAATTQKPRCVVETLTKSYLENNANVHRGVHYLSQLATEAHENARKEVADFIGASSEREIVFTRGCTDSLNLVASAYGEAFLKEGDEVIVSEMEHHSNIVPWQFLQEKKGVVLKVIPVQDDGTLDLQAYKALLSDRTRIVSVAHMSNVLGTVNPIRDMVALAHEAGAVFVVDAAQSLPHMPIDVQELGADFLAFSAHKVYGPTGVGVLFGREELLEKMPPYQGGGEMIAHVSFKRTTYDKLPYKFEAGTPDYVGTVAFSSALAYLKKIGYENIQAHEAELMTYAMEQLKEIDDLHIYGSAPERGAVVSFNIGKIHHLDIGTLLDRLGIAVRTGHHCAEPLMNRFSVEGMVRASFALYNTKSEIDALANGLRRIRKMF